MIFCNHIRCLLHNKIFLSILDVCCITIGIYFGLNHCRQPIRRVKRVDRKKPSKPTIDSTSILNKLTAVLQQNQGLDNFFVTKKRILYNYILNIGPTTAVKMGADYSLSRLRHCQPIVVSTKNSIIILL